MRLLFEVINRVGLVFSLFVFRRWNSKAVSRCRLPPHSKKYLRTGFLRYIIGLGGFIMADKYIVKKGWHHSPVHKLSAGGAYIVSCGTYKKVPYISTPQRLSEFQYLLFKYADKYGWRLQAWAIMSNHYHWVGLSPEKDNGGQSLKKMTSELHQISAKRFNIQDNTKGRRVWFNYWETHITYQRSYYSRLKYVHDNPAHHKIIANAANYPWCSRAWFEREASSAFVNQIDSFKTDKLKIPDDF
jgi:putative transposase